MCKLKYWQLTKHFEKVLNLRELQAARNGMDEYRAELFDNEIDNEISESLAYDIKLLDEKITAIKSELEVSRNDIEKGLSCVKDDLAVSAVIWHYCEGLSWAVIAYKTKYGTDNGIKNRVYRALRKAGIK